MTTVSLAPGTNVFFFFVIMTEIYYQYQSSSSTEGSDLRHPKLQYNTMKRKKTNLSQNGRMLDS